MSLAEIAQLAADHRLPPVERWNPAHCGHSGMRIAADGRWWHEGAPINRDAMVRLFSTVLRREEDGRHVLVTPAEKLDIDVEDLPFVATAVSSEGEGPARRLAFSTNIGDLVVAGPDHPVGIKGGRPAVLVRRGLWARLARPVFYELADWALGEGAEPLGIWSDGAFFPLSEDA